MLWGDGSSLREFLHVTDLARAVLFTIENDVEKTLYNIGSGGELSIKKLASIIASTVGYQGNIIWDKSMPNGSPRKILDSTQILNLGWKPEIIMEKGIQSTYKWYLKNIFEKKFILLSFSKIQELQKLLNQKFNIKIFYGKNLKWY